MDAVQSREAQSIAHEFALGFVEPEGFSHFKRDVYKLETSSGVFAVKDLGLIRDINEDSAGALAGFWRRLDSSFEWQKICIESGVKVASPQFTRSGSSALKFDNSSNLLRSRMPGQHLLSVHRWVEGRQLHIRTERDAVNVGRLVGSATARLHLVNIESNPKHDATHGNSFDLDVLRNWAGAAGSEFESRVETIMPQLLRLGSVLDRNIHNTRSRTHGDIHIENLIVENITGDAVFIDFDPDHSRNEPVIKEVERFANFFEDHEIIGGAVQRAASQFLFSAQCTYLQEYRRQGLNAADFAVALQLPAAQRLKSSLQWRRRNEALDALNELEVSAKVIEHFDGLAHGLENASLAMVPARLISRNRSTIEF